MFGARLKELQQKNGYTQVTLAGKLGVSKGTVAMWEVGKRKPDFETLCTLSELFDVRTDYILGQSDDDSSITFLIRILNSLGRGLQRKASKNFLSYILLLILTAKIR